MLAAFVRCSQVAWTMLLGLIAGFLTLITAAQLTTSTSLAYVAAGAGTLAVATISSRKALGSMVPNDHVRTGGSRQR